jgi:5-methyltetrahydrofolate--homocysteine methyltransferase
MLPTRPACTVFPLASWYWHTPHQAKALIDGGVDILITDVGSRISSCQTTEAFWTSVSHADPFCVDLNCALSVESLRTHIEKLSRVTDTLVSVHPSAGLPNELGGYDDTPEYITGVLREFPESGFVNIVGG